MSTYIRNTKHPHEDKFMPALWIDDYFGRHHYGVQFLGSEVIWDPEIHKMETNDKKVKATFTDFHEYKSDEFADSLEKELDDMEDTNDFITKASKKTDYGNGFTRDTDEGKIRYDLIPISMLKRLAELYTRGAKLYGDENWKLAQGDAVKNFKRSAFRHFIQWANGEYDEDHASAIVFNVFGFEWHKMEDDILNN